MNNLPINGLVVALEMAFASRKAAAQATIIAEEPRFVSEQEVELTLQPAIK